MYESDTDIRSFLLNHVHSNVQALAGVRGPLDGDPTLAKLMLHGTTIGALFVQGGAHAIAFSDGRVSSDTEVFDDEYDKVLRIDDYSYFLISGDPGVGKLYARALRNYVGAHEDSLQAPMDTRSKITFLSDLLRRNFAASQAGMICVPLFVTFDRAEKERARIFSLMPNGAELERKDTGFIMGSGRGVGSQMLLDRKWRDEPPQSITDGVALARTILDESTGRDHASGGKYHLKIVDAQGARMAEETGS